MILTFYALLYHLHHLFQISHYYQLLWQVMQLKSCYLFLQHAKINIRENINPFFFLSSSKMETSSLVMGNIFVPIKPFLSNHFQYKLLASRVIIKLPNFHY